MGFRGLVPADHLAASYDPQKQLLTLYASGNVQKFTYGIVFQRDADFVGGLKFSLQGWTGPLTPGTEPYKWTQDVKIQLLTPYYVVNPKQIIVVTADQPNGVVVPIEWLNSDNPPKDSTSAPLSNSADLADEKSSPSSAIEPVQPSKDLWVLFDMEFEVVDAHELSKDIRANVNYDQQFLVMKDAGTPNGKLTWIFNSLKTGNTQITVTTTIAPGPTGGQPIALAVTTYNVHIFVLPLASLKLYLGSGEKESFLANVGAILNKVQTKYPDAKLYEVEAGLPKPESPPTTDPTQLTKLRVVFQNADNTTVTITSQEDWGEWNEPVLIPQPWLEDIVIPWPIEMDIVKAAKILEDKYTAPFFACTLRHPLQGPDSKIPDQPYYIFGTGDFTWYLVGVNDGQVYVEKDGGLKLQITSGAKAK